MSALSNTMNPALSRLGEVSVRLSVELGRTEMALKDVISLAEGSVVSLDKLTDELLDITANGQIIAHGEVIAQDGKFALRIVSLAGGDEPVSAPPRTRPSGGPVPDATRPQPRAPDVPPPNAPVQNAPGFEVPNTSEPAPLAEETMEPNSETEATSEADFTSGHGDEQAPTPAPSTPEASAPLASEGTPNGASEEPEVDPLLDELDELTEGQPDDSAEPASEPPAEDDAI